MNRHTGHTFETSSVEKFREYVLLTSTVIGDKPIQEIILEHSGLHLPGLQELQISPIRGRKSPQTKQLQSLRQINAAKLHELGQPWETQYLPHDNKITRNSLVLEQVIMARITDHKMHLPSSLL